MIEENVKGYMLSLLSIIIWGITYIFTKNLLQVLTPYEILFYRFSLAYIILFIIRPRFDFQIKLKEEFLFLGLGFFGVTSYFLLENLALKYTQASNVGLIVSSIPIFTAIIAHFMHKDEQFHKNLIFGFVSSIIGITIIIFNGDYSLNLSKLGDFLALLCALVWAIYSNLLKKVDKTISPILIAKKTFFYGLVMIIPIVIYNGIDFQISKLVRLNILGSLLFLSLFASVIAFIMWNKAIHLIGSIKTSNFIYLVPLITMISAYLVLSERITLTMIAGGCLILLGVYIGERNNLKIHKVKHHQSSIHDDV